jgi:septal ring factor EnvC (AmiA/AmiB activator)
MAADPRRVMIGQAFAMRVLTTWLHAQISEAQPELERQIGEHQREIARLQATMERSRSVLTSLQMTIEQLDDTMRNAISQARRDSGVSHDNAPAGN